MSFSRFNFHPIFLFHFTSFFGRISRLKKGAREDVFRSISFPFSLFFTTQNSLLFRREHCFSSDGHYVNKQFTWHGFDIEDHYDNKHYEETVLVARVNMRKLLGDFNAYTETKYISVSVVCNKKNWSEWQKDCLNDRMTQRLIACKRNWSDFIHLQTHTFHLEWLFRKKIVKWAKIISWVTHQK